MLLELSDPVGGAILGEVVTATLDPGKIDVASGRSSARFLAVRSPQQLLPQGVIALPTVFVAHKFIGLQADVTEEAARLAVRNWIPFLSGAASREGLLPVA